MQIPNDVQSESFLLAKMLTSVNASNDAITALTSEDFNDPRHKAIFSSMCALYASDCEIEPMTVASTLTKDYPDYADTAYLLGLTMHKYGDYDDVKLFINNIKECSRLKRLIYIGSELSTEAASGNKKSEEIHVKALTNIEDVFSEGFEKTSRTVAELAVSNYAESGLDFLNYIEKQMENHAKGIKVLRGLPTGYSKLDDILGGLCKGHFIIVGARPGAGKTTFALNLMLNTARKGISVGFFSLEMTAGEAMSKIISMDSGVSAEKADRGQLTHEEFRNIVVSHKNLNNLKIVIDDQESLRVSQLVSRAKRMVAANKIEVLFIDYLGEVKGDGKFITKQEEIQSVSKGLRALAKKLKIPVVCICQLNRASETEKRAPNKSDLRESGQIEADAHSILLLEKPSIDSDNQLDKPGLVKIHIVKNRFGKQGCIHFGFDGPTGKFLEIDYRAEQEKIRDWHDTDDE